MTRKNPVEDLLANAVQIAAEKSATHALADSVAVSIADALTRDFPEGIYGEPYLLALAGLIGAHLAAVTANGVLSEEDAARELIRAGETIHEVYYEALDQFRVEAKEGR